jgi:cytochrome c-type biogenesis protein
MTALPVSEVGSSKARAVTLRAALLFVVGFTLVFTALGASSALVGNLLLRNLPVIIRVAGIGIIVMGLAMLGVLRIPMLSSERRLNPARIPRGPKYALPMGMAFAVGWVPCIGPILATILTAAAATQTVAWGAFLLALYSLGLGVPFVLMAVGLQRWRGSFDWLRRNARRIEHAGGAILVGVGILFVIGAWQQLFIPLQRMVARFGWPPI